MGVAGMQSVTMLSFLLLAVSIYRGAAVWSGVTKDCEDWSALQPGTIDVGEKKCFTSRDRYTNRCIMRYKTAGACNKMKFTCSEFNCQKEDMFSWKQTTGPRISATGRRTRYLT